MSLGDVLAFVGGLTLGFHFLRLAWRCWRGLRQYVLSEMWPVDVRKYGQWAVVTGATSGIGKGYAFELASRGLDIVLVSRSQDKLQMVAKEIESQYGRKTRTIQVDFTNGGDIYPGIAEKLQGLEIGVLVNNVGMLYSQRFAFFLDVPNAEQKINQTVNCNMLSVVQMTRLILPAMVERGRGLIINVSSVAASRPQPLFALYSATKIFVTYFSQCLQSEYKQNGIDVQCVAPFMVSTNMTDNIHVNLLVKSASAFAYDALNTVGYSSYTNGCLSHALQYVALRTFLPDWLNMSQFFIRRFREKAESDETERGTHKEIKKLGEKEE